MSKTKKRKPIKDIKGEKTQSAVLKKIPYRLECSYDKLIKIDELHLNPDNPNDHPEKQVLLLAEILKTNGVRRPIRVSMLSGMVSAGHCQLLAMKLNGWDYVPVDFQEYKDEADEWNDVVADNALAQLSKLNYSKINEVIVTLGPDYDPCNMGLIDFKIEPAEKGGGPNDADDQDDERAKVQTKKGQVYKLGSHRLTCGKETDESDSIVNHWQKFTGKKAELRTSKEKKKPHKKALTRIS